MAEIYGWVGRILRIDLTEQRITTLDTMQYAEKYIGGRGIVARLGWEEIKPDIKEFDSENKLIIMTGPLAGTMAPLSGRIEFGAVAPQAYPKPWFNRSNMGGWFGSELKYAGFDGIIVQGKSEKPIYIWINDAEVEFVDGDEIWGKDIFSTQQHLLNSHGEDVKAICIGPAGEKCSRISVIQSETENAAGQGGLGAVMGSKNLKAIVAKGSGTINVAKPEEFLEVCMAINKAFQLQNILARARADETSNPKRGVPYSSPPSPKEESRKYRKKGITCSHACPTQCGCMWLPSEDFPNLDATYCSCAANIWSAFALELEGRIEISTFANKMGLNHWEFFWTIMPWLRECEKKGFIKEVDGDPIKLSDSQFWVKLLRKVAYREGIGNIFAEGGPRAADILGKGKEIMRQFDPAYGYPAPWGLPGHIMDDEAPNCTFFPRRIVAALQWFTDTRIPFRRYPLAHAFSWPWGKLKKISAIVYGSEKAIDPECPYEWKAQPAIWHQHESVLEDSLPLCSAQWPQLYSALTEDGYYRTTTPTHGTIGGKSLDYYLYVAATGLNITKSDFRKCAERIFNLERAIQVRNYGRTRQDDMAIITYFEKPETWTSPSGKKESLNRSKFLQLVDEFYELRGWDRKTGIPTRARLESLDLKDVADELENQQ